MFAHFALVNGATKSVIKKSVINTISLLLPPVSDWPIIMIRPGGLPSVVSHLFAVSVSIVWVRLQEKVNKSWM
jgi:hypothetical protein